MSVTADSVTMSNAYDDFSQILSVLDEVLEELDAELKSSLDEWDGQARQAFDEAHRAWSHSAADMARQLADLRQAIATADGNYARCEAANIAMFSQGR